MANKTTRYNKNKLPELVKALKQKMLTSREIAVILEMGEDVNSNMINNTISYLSLDIPIFETEVRKNHLYGLLTPDLLEQTEAEELKRRRKENDRN